MTRDLVAHVRDVYVACVAGARAELFEGGSEQAETLAAEAAAFGEHPADRLARVLTVLDDAALEMRARATCAWCSRLPVRAWHVPRLI